MNLREVADLAEEIIRMGGQRAVFIRAGKAVSLNVEGQRYAQRLARGECDSLVGIYGGDFSPLQLANDLEAAGVVL